MTPYPKEIFASIRENKSLAILAQFTRAVAEQDDMPLAVYDRRFSRFVFTGIDSENKRSVSANVPVSEVANIFAVTDYANTKHLDALYGGKQEQAQESDVTSIAYTMKITSGTLKGKSPAEVLLEDPEHGAEKLNQQYKWLKGNLAQYPKNQLQMDAITEAAKLQKAGKLSAGNVNNNTTRINLYHAEARALQRKQREDGMCPVYNLDISWDVGEKVPVDITITTFYAPLKKNDNGTINPVVSQMDKTTYAAVNKRLTAGEWLNAVRCAKTAMLQFEVANASACITNADNAEKANRQAAGIPPVGAQPAAGATA